MTTRITPRQLLLAAADAHVLWPDAELVKNGMGGLSACVDGVYVGFIDLDTGEVVELKATPLQNATPIPREGEK